MKVRVWAVDTKTGENILRGEFEMVDGKVVVRGEETFVTRMKENPEIFMDDDTKRENPITPEDGEDYLTALPHHFRGSMVWAEWVEEGTDADAG